MKQLAEYSFRELQDQYLYIETAVDEEEATGIVAYGFISHEQGICFKPLAAAGFDAENKSLKLLAFQKTKIDCLTVVNLREKLAMPLPAGLPVFEQFIEQLEEVKHLSVCSQEVEQTRLVQNLDGCRAMDNPDVVTVQLVRGGAVESCYVLLEGIKEMFFYGILLQEPQNDLGIHLGEVISFYNVRNQEGIMCLAVFE